jgi:hypothetical protein
VAVTVHERGAEVIARAHIGIYMENFGHFVRLCTLVLLRYVALYTGSEAEMSKSSYSYLGIIWKLHTFRYLSTNDDNNHHYYCDVTLTAIFIG